MKTSKGFRVRIPACSPDFDWRYGIPGSEPELEGALLAIRTEKGINGLSLALRGAILDDPVNRGLRAELLGQHPLASEYPRHRRWEIARIGSFPSPPHRLLHPLEDFSLGVAEPVEIRDRYSHRPAGRSRRGLRLGCPSTLHRGKVVLSPSLATAVLSDAPDKVGLREQVLTDHLVCVVPQPVANDVLRERTHAAGDSQLLSELLSGVTLRRLRGGVRRSMETPHPD